MSRFFTAETQQKRADSNADWAIREAEKCVELEKENATLRKRVEVLEAENFRLAAGQCIVPNGLLGDEHGHQYCALQDKPNG